jgi:hypothetical protein
MATEVDVSTPGTVVLDDPESIQPEPASESRASPTARWFERVGPCAPALLLCLSSFLLVVVYLGTPVAEGNRGLTNLTESYGALERVALWQRAFDWLPGIGTSAGDFTLAPGVIAWSSRLGIVGLCLAQAWAFWLAWRGIARSLLTWLLPPIVAQVVMIGLVPSNADVFFYEMTGDLAANGINPYAHALMEFPDHPLLPFNHWIEMTAVYGPVWTSINAAIMSIMGPDPTAATIAYKIFFGVVAIALSVLVYWFVRHLTQQVHLARIAAILVAWQPAMILESAGQAHNDPVMLLLSTAGIFLVIAGGSGAVRGGVILTSLSALVKYVTLPLLALLALTRLNDRHRNGGLPRVILGGALDVVAFVLVAFVAFFPFWNGVSTVTEMLAEPGRLYTNPLWFDTYLLLEWLFPPGVASAWADITRLLLQLISIAIVGGVIVRFGQFCWRHAAVEGAPIPRLPVWTRPLIVSWTIVLTTLALLPVNSHPWYWTWPIVPIATLITFDAAQRQVPGADASLTPPAPASSSLPSVSRWFWAYLVLMCVMTLAYHTRIVHL